MIKLTRLNGDEFVVNAELIRFIESRPDTYVTLTTDEKLIVRESVDEVVHRAICYARALRMTPEIGGWKSEVGSRR
jgi:flagellar protein FlbD